MSAVNGTAVVVPPIDPGNPFVLAGSDPDDVLFDVDPDSGRPDVALLTTNGATVTSNGERTRVLMTTFRSAGVTVTARLVREVAVALGRALLHAGEQLPAPLEVVGVVDEQRDVPIVRLTFDVGPVVLELRLSGADAVGWGRQLIAQGQGLSGLHLPGVHP